jgi:hypothetical protein
MPENSLFFDAIIAARSVMLSEEQALEGATTLSLETQIDMAESDVLSYIENDFPGFVKILRHLSKEDQELLLGYYVISKTQTSLAPIHGLTQTICSAHIRAAMRKMGTYIIFGPPTPEIMAPIFIEAELEGLLKKTDGTVVPLSEVVALYAKTRSYQRVAEVLGLRRPEVRRVMRSAQKVLAARSGIKAKAISAYLLDLIDKSSASGKGPSQRKLAKQGDLYVRTPAILGKFRIDVTDPDFNQVFVSRANR